MRVLDRKSGRELDLPYDRLIMATGARSRKLSLPGEESENIFTLKDLADGLRIRRFIDGQQPRKAVIIGAGYISLEVAEALRERGIETTLLYRGEAPYSGLEPELGPIIVEELTAHGVRFLGGVQPQAFEVQGERAVSVHTAQGEFPGDLFFIGTGVQPNIELAREAGIVIGEAGGIRVNDRMETNDPMIFAAGDCCEKYHRVAGRSVLSPLGDTANKEGRVAGENAVGGKSQFHGIVGAACVKVFGLEIGMAGLTEAQAQKLGFTVLSQVVEASSRVGIYPGVQTLALKDRSRSGYRSPPGRQLDRPGRRGPKDQHPGCGPVQ